MLLKKFIVQLYWKFLTTHFVFKSNNYLCRCVRVGWGRFRASTRLVKWSHFKARARAATPGKCGYIKEHEHYTIYFLPKNQKDSVKSQKDSVSPRFSEKTQKMHTISVTRRSLIGDNYQLAVDYILDPSFLRDTLFCTIWDLWNNKLSCPYYVFRIQFLKFQILYL